MASERKRSETFSSIDAAWLHIDTPMNMAMITGVMMFDEPPDFDRLKATIECRTPRRSSRISMPSSSK
jgi:diacylglycerol O-acyltransferase / wax synthase